MAPILELNNSVCSSFCWEEMEVGRVGLPGCGRIGRMAYPVRGWCWPGLRDGSVCGPHSRHTALTLFQILPNLFRAVPLGAGLWALQGLKGDSVGSSMKGKHWLGSWESGSYVLSP